MSFTNSQKKKFRGVKSGMGPLFLSNDQETPCPQRHENDWRSEVVHHLTVKLFLQGHCLVRVHLIKLVWNTGVRVQLSRPQYAVHLLPHGKHLFI